MKVPGLLFLSLIGKVILAAVALGGLLSFVGAPAVQASSWQDCNRRVAYTNKRYQEAVERFGRRSPAAHHWAFERHEAIVRCR